MNAPRGVTLIELIIVVAILASMGVVSFSTFRTGEQQSRLNATTNEVVQALRTARERTLASVGSTQHGVHLASDRYVHFEGATYGAVPASYEEHLLPPGVQIGNFSLGGGSDIVFDRLSGEVTTAGTFEVQRSDQPTIKKTIRVLTTGLVSEASTVTATGSRITDTRHMHFALPWTIQGASTLTFTFSQWPQADSVHTVSMSPYFNDDGSFAYEGTLIAYGEPQTLRVESTSITGVATTLDVRRDRSLNTQAVAISIDGHPIVSYSAAGTATVGSSGGTMTNLSTQ